MVTKSVSVREVDFKLFKTRLFRVTMSSRVTAYEIFSNGFGGQRQQGRNIHGNRMIERKMEFRESRFSHTFHTVLEV